MTVEELQALLEQGRNAVDEHEAALTAAYERVLAGVARRVARSFREDVTVLAASEQWAEPPRPGDLVDAEAAARSARRRAGPIQEVALAAVVTPTTNALGISFEVAAPLTERIMQALAARAETVAEGIGPIVSDVIRKAHAEGLSVTETAKLIRARIDTLKAWQALLLARSDLVAIGNGGSLAAVEAARTAGVEVKTKTWLTAGDERVRPTHVGASGQTVPIDQLFLVGVGSLQYPGDPSGPPEETWACRCTALYGEQPAPVRAAGALLAEGGPDASELAMVAVYPRPEEAERLAVEGGLEPSDLHCTLVFLGEADDVDEESAREALALVASELAPLAGAVGGLGHFAENEDGVPVILLPDVQGLTLLRERVVDELGHRGIRSPSEHGFLPHITLTYAESDELPNPGALGEAIHFAAVSLVVGGRRTDYALEGARTASAALGSTLASVTSEVS